MEVNSSDPARLEQEALHQMQKTDHHPPIQFIKIIYKLGTL